MKNLIKCLILIPCFALVVTACAGYNDSDDNKKLSGGKGKPAGKLAKADTKKDIQDAQNCKSNSPMKCDLLKFSARLGKVSQVYGSIFYALHNKSIKVDNYILLIQKHLSEMGTRKGVKETRESLSLRVDVPQRIKKNGDAKECKDRILTVSLLSHSLAQYPQDWQFSIQDCSKEVMKVMTWKLTSAKSSTFVFDADGLNMLTQMGPFSGLGIHAKCPLIEFSSESADAALEKMTCVDLGQWTKEDKYTRIEKIEYVKNSTKEMLINAQKYNGFVTGNKLLMKVPVSGNIALDEYLSSENNLDLKVEETSANEKPATTTAPTPAPAQTPQASEPAAEARDPNQPQAQDMNGDVPKTRAEAGGGIPQTEENVDPCEGHPQVEQCRQNLEQKKARAAMHKAQMQYEQDPGAHPDLVQGEEEPQVEGEQTQDEQAEVDPNATVANDPSFRHNEAQ